MRRQLCQVIRIEIIELDRDFDLREPDRPFEVIKGKYNSILYDDKLIIDITRTVLFVIVPASDRERRTCFLTQVVDIYLSNRQMKFHYEMRVLVDRQLLVKVCVWWLWKPDQDKLGILRVIFHL